MKTRRHTVLAPADSGYVLPAPPRGQGGLFVVGGGQSAMSAMRRGAEVARALGGRFEMQAESLKLLLDETRERLSSLDAAIAEDARAQLKGSVRELVGLIDWCDALQCELASESGRARLGQEPIDVGELCRQVARQCESPALQVTVTAACEVIWWGECAALAGALELALSIVGERSQGGGPRALEVTVDGQVPCVHVTSRGEPADTIDPESIDRFRAAVEKIGASIVPDAFGPGGTGLVMRLPV